MNVATVSRALGHTAARAIGYDFGIRLLDPSGNQIPRWLASRHGPEGISGTEILGWHGDAQSLADAIEAAETRRDARIGRKVCVALPSELNRAQRQRLLRAFAIFLRESTGAVVTWAEHEPGPYGDCRNNHGHCFVSPRACDGATFSKKIRRLDDIKTGPLAIIEWRKKWERLSNAHLEQAGFDVRISAESLDAQGKSATPAKHAGAKKTAHIRAGYSTSGNKADLPTYAELKSRLDLAKVAAAHGYVIDIDGGTRGKSRQLRRDDGSGEIIITGQQYFSRSTGQGGSVVDFGQKELGWGQRETREKLTALAGASLPEPPTKRFAKKKVAASAPSRRKVPIMRGENENAEIYLARRGISTETREIFAGSFVTGGRGVEFPHTEADGKGAEIRGPNDKGFSPEGKKGLWLFSPGSGDTLVVAESGINAMSHAQIHGHPDGTAYCSHAGGLSSRVLSAIIHLAQRIGARLLLSAHDADTAGDRFAAQLKAAARSAGFLFSRSRPRKEGHDWNEELKPIYEKPKPKRRIHKSKCNETRWDGPPSPISAADTPNSDVCTAASRPACGPHDVGVAGRRMVGSAPGDEGVVAALQPRTELDGAAIPRGSGACADKLRNRIGTGLTCRSSRRGRGSRI